MAELSIFLSKAEYKAAMRYCLASGFRVLPDKKLSCMPDDVAPQPPYVSSEASLSAAIDGGTCGYLLERPDFTKYPVRLRQAEYEGNFFWYPNKFEGGPVIEAYYWEPLEREGRRVIPCSLFAYHSKIINPDTRLREPAGTAAKAAFSELTSYLRKGARRIGSVHRTRTAFVTREVDTLLAEGWELGPPFDVGPP